MLSREVIDLYISWGYQLVMPPMIEYMDSLLAVPGKDLELQIFTLTDQLSGRLLGVRADITPQVARIDAHNLKREMPTRLCYFGTVLRTGAGSSKGNRNLLQVGSELYGHKGIESDAEILCLMIETLALVGIRTVHVDLGHVGIYNKLASMAGVNEEQKMQLFDVLQRKAIPELNELISAWHLMPAIGKLLRLLVFANGAISELRTTIAAFAEADPEIQQYLNELGKIATLVSTRNPDVELHFDLAELRSYHYHTGIVFTAYVPSHAQGVAFGGRYDGIGQAFGRSRPATGFSADVKTLLDLGNKNLEQRQGIFVPYGHKDSAALWRTIAELRKQGEIVICELPTQHNTPEDMGCDRRLEFKDGRWQALSL